MPDYQNDKRSDYSKYDSMTNDELEEILRMDAMRQDDEESDMDMLMYVMGVLAKRRRDSADSGKTAEEAYQSFLDNYYSDDIEVANDNIHNAIAFAPKGNHSRIRRYLTVAAACVAIVFCGVITTTALGGNSLDRFFDWTKEIFSFSSMIHPAESGPSNEYQSMDDSWANVLLRMNVPEKIMPRQILDGFEQIEIAVTETPAMRSISGRFSNGQDEYRMTVNAFLIEDPYMIEKTDALIEIYEKDGIKYYFFSNMNQLTAVWQVDQYECMIVGDLDVEETKQLIHSAQKG